MPGLTGKVPVLAIRRGEERFSSLKGLLMTDVENVRPKLVYLTLFPTGISQVMEEVSGRVGNCTKFLHQGKELEGPEQTEITASNRETHRALLLPITVVFKPTEILYICDGMYDTKIKEILIYS